MVELTNPTKTLWRCWFFVAPCLASCLIWARAGFTSSELRGIVKCLPLVKKHGPSPTEQYSYQDKIWCNGVFVLYSYKIMHVNVLKEMHIFLQVIEKLSLYFLSPEIFFYISPSDDASGVILYIHFARFFSQSWGTIQFNYILSKRLMCGPHCKM